MDILNFMDLFIHKIIFYNKDIIFYIYILHLYYKIIFYNKGKIILNG